MAKEPIIYRFRRNGNALVPAARFDLALLDALSNGEAVDVEISRKRNRNRFRLYWRTLAFVIQSTGEVMSAETLHKALKLECGVADAVKLPDGRTILLPGETRFNSMTETEFQDYFQKAQAQLAEWYGIDPLAFYQEEAA